MKKKAQILDMIYMSFIALMVIVLGLVMYKVVDDYNSEASDDIRAKNMQPVQDYVSRAPSVLQGLFLVVLIGLAIIAIASAFFVASHPVFYGFFMVLLGIMSWINAIYANFWYDLSSDGMFASYANNLPIINMTLKYYPLVLFIIGLIIGIAMMAKGE